MASSKKSTAKSAASKKSARSEKKSATRAKTPARKKTEPTAKAGAAKSSRPSRAKSAPPREKKKPAAPRPARTAAAPGASRKETRKQKKAAPPGPPRTLEVGAGSPLASKLGTKWNCFQCGAKFYDLHKPEPLCPKCGADQRQRPKVTASATPTPPPPRRAPRPMAPLLDDEDDGTVRYDEEFDLGLRGDVDDAEEELFPPGDAEEDDVFSGGEDE